MPGRFATITEDEVIARIKMQLRLKDTSQDAFLSILVNEGLRHLGALSIFKKQECTLEIENGKAKLPSGFYRYLALRSGCDGIIYADKDYLIGCGCEIPDNIYNWPDIFQIEKGIIYFPSDFTDTTADLAYLGLNVDDNDRIIVYEDYERALNAYACWNFCLAYSEDYKEATISRYQHQWIAQKNWIKGNDVANDFQNTKREVQEAFTALLSSALINVK